MNIVHHAQESGGVFHERGLIAALKKVSAFGPKPVEANGKGGLQPVHAIAQVRNGCGQSQVEMVSQNREGVDFPPKSGAGLTQRGLDGTRGSGRFENVAPVIPAIDDVINRSWILNAKPACHATSKAAAGRGTLHPPPPNFGASEVLSFPTNVSHAPSRR